MFCLKTALLNIRRHRQKSVLVVLVCMLAVFFVFIFVNSIKTNEEQLVELPRSLPVDAQIQNLNGSQAVGLIIGGAMVENIEKSGYVKDLYCSAQMVANFSSLDDEDKVKEIFLKSINDINAIANVKDSTVKLIDGVDVGFLNGNEALCIADENFLYDKDLSIGDTIDINLYGLSYDSQSREFEHVPLGPCSLLIAGSISSGGESHIICPHGWAKGMHLAAGANFNLESTSFTVADPMDLNAFKQAMKKCHLMSVNPLAEGNIYGGALSVRDEIFIKTVTRIRDSLSMLYAFAPVIFAVTALIGYALSYLLMQSRRAEIMIMRSLGASRPVCMTVMFIEYAVLGLAGTLLGTLCSAVSAGFLGLSPLLAALLFILSFLIGILCAAFQISARNIMSGFIKVEA